MTVRTSAGDVDGRRGQVEGVGPVQDPGWVVAVEQAVEGREVIGAERPADAVLGEERGGAVTGADRGWVLDPIDGTKNFSRGVPVWATLIALTVGGEAVVGVASAPALGRRWWAARGEGAWTSEPANSPRRVSVSGVSELGDAYLSTTDIATFTELGRRDHYLRLVDACWETRAFGDFWQYCLVAEGVLDLAVDAAANPWDLAALAPILAEAGGMLTDLTGAATYAGGDGLASNGAIHEAALAIVGR